MKWKKSIGGFWENYLADKSQKEGLLLPLCFWTMPLKIVMPGAAREGITNLLRMAEQKVETARVLSENFTLLAQSWNFLPLTFCLVTWIFLFLKSLLCILTVVAKCSLISQFKIDRSSLFPSKLLPERVRGFWSGLWILVSWVTDVVLAPIWPSATL